MVQQTSFTTPGYDYGVELGQIDRKRKLAEALQQQSMQETPQQTAGGWIIPTSPLQGAAKLAQAFAARRGEEKADVKQKELTEKIQGDYRTMLAKGLGQLQGTPAMPGGDGSREDGYVAPPTPAQPADPMGAMATFGSHPQGAQFMPLAMQEMSRQRLAAALGGGGSNPTMAGSPSPQAAPAATPGPYASIAPTLGGSAQPPQAQPASAPTGGPAGGLPMQAWLQIDPSGAKYMEQLAKDHAEGQKPVVNRGFGLGRMVNGQYVPDQASLTQALEMERGKADVHAPLEAPVNIKTSSGQDLQLSRPEYAAFQKTGQLPQRYGQTQMQPQGQPLPVNVPEADRAAYESVASGKVPAAYGPTPSSAKPQGLGTVGATQTQADAIQQAGQTASNTEAGKEFISEMRQNYAKLRDVPATLENIDRAKTLAAGEAAKFMGPFGDSKLAITKFMRSNLPGMGNLKTDSVTSAEELQSTLFNQVMDNLKKMDASPSQYQQQVMQEAFGTLRTDPKSVPKILDVFSDILRNRVDLHNHTVKSAESRGTAFPYDVNVKLPERGAGLNLSPATREFMRANGIQPP